MKVLKKASIAGSLYTLTVQDTLRGKQYIVRADGVPITSPRMVYEDAAREFDAVTLNN